MIDEMWMAKARSIGPCALSRPSSIITCGAAVALLARLEHEHHPASQLARRRSCSSLGGAGEHGDVGVMAAGVHLAVDLEEKSRPVSSGISSASMSARSRVVGRAAHPPKRPPQNSCAYRWRSRGPARPGLEAQRAAFRADRAPPLGGCGYAGAGRRLARVAPALHAKGPLPLSPSFRTVGRSGYASHRRPETGPVAQVMSKVPPARQ